MSGLVFRWVPVIPYALESTPLKRACGNCWQIDGKEVAAVPEEPSVAPASGAWGLLPVFVKDDVCTGEFLHLIPRVETQGNNAFRR